MAFIDSLKNVQSTNNEESNLVSQPMAMSLYDTATVDTEDYTRSPKYDWYSNYQDENFSTVSTNKDIVVNPLQINLTQEENSQFIPFKLPRYWDGIDLMEMSLKIRYANSKGEESIDSPCNVRFNATEILFAWLVDGKATYLAGELTFEIFATGVNEKNEPYTWRTRPNGKLNIEHSLVGNGMVQPDTDWLTQFIREIDVKIANVQEAANSAQQSADRASASATEAQTVVDNASTQIEQNVKNSIDAELAKFCTSDELNKVKDQIENIDGLAKFKIAYSSDTNTLSFYNGEVLIKSVVLNTNPSLEWVTAYDSKMGTKIDEKVKIVQDDLDSYKATVTEDLKAIHQNIDNLPTTLESDYYTKTQTNTLLADKANVSAITGLTTRVSAVESSAATNKTNVEAMSGKIAELEKKIDQANTDPTVTYDVNYESDTGLFTFYELEGEEDPSVNNIKRQFTITGGGGGSTSSTTIKIDRITPSPLIVTKGNKAIIEYSFSSVDSSGDDTGEGTATWKVGNSTVATSIALQGKNSFDLTDYVTVGSQKVTLTIVDSAGALSVKNWTVQVIDVRLESTFSDNYTYPLGEVVFSYIPYGSIEKTVHFILDEKEIGTVVTSVSGIPLSYTLPSQTHGAHLLEVYITASVNGTQIETNHIFKDILWYDNQNDDPVIGCISKNLTVQQYDTENIVYTIYDPKTENPTVTLAVDGKEVSTLKLDSNTQTWQYKPTEIGTHVLTITCRNVVKTINATVEKLDIDVEPVTAGLQFDFNPVGRSNNDANRLWSSDINSDIKMTVSENFDWENGGYQIDENGDSYFGIKAGTSAVISYNLFADDARQSGKEFKLIFMTKNVAKANATFLSCESGGIGLQMNVHEAYIKSSAKSLYVPYSEEDIIEWEFNINKDTDIPIVMSYEDGTPCRPMSYTKDYSFTQEEKVPITIGSDDCDVRIYRMKTYNSSLTTKAILSNFIADARTATEMIDRYKRNQIYNENQVLTPESVAEACPNLRVIKIEAPYFTNDKKNFVKNTSMECIYKNGDPILDNWKFENCYHSGQGTTSNEYGQAGRNIDVICCADGTNQINSKITLDPDYKTKLTLGDGTVVDDGTGKISLTRNSVPNNWWNFKVNIASSELANNAYMQNRYNTYLPYTSPAQRRDSKVKNDMEFVNCVIFIKENNADISTHREFQDTDWHFYALGNMGDSKKTDITRAYDPDDMNEYCIEVSDNTLANSTFQTGLTTSDGKIKYPISKGEWKAGNTAYDALYNDWDGSFEFRYDCCGDSKDGQAISSDEAKEKIRTKNRQIWRDFYEFVITSSDADFVAKLKNWFIVDSALYFYLFTLRYTMIDNRAKNVFYHWAKYYITEEEAATLGDKAKYYTIDNEAAAINNGYRYDLWDYDNDTALGIKC